MNFFRALKQDLNKSLINIGFLGAVLLTCVLGFTAPAYVETATDKSYSVFEAFFTLDKDFIGYVSDFASVRLFTLGLSGYITMFIPIIVAFPFMVSFCAERNSGLMRFAITRSGKLNYYLSKFTASFLSGGLAVALGMIIYGVAVWVMFPSIGSYNLDAETLSYIIPDGLYKTVVKFLVSAFLYGAVSTLPAFFISSFCKNPYIITCLPFLFTYIWSTTINKICVNAFEKMDFEIYEKVDPFRPDSIQQLVHINFSEITTVQRNTIIFNAAYIAVLLVGFVVIMNLHTDKGN